MRSFSTFTSVPTGTNGSLNEGAVTRLLGAPIEPIPRDAALSRGSEFRPVVSFPGFLLVILGVAEVGRRKFSPLGLSLSSGRLLRRFRGVGVATSFMGQFTCGLLGTGCFLSGCIIRRALNRSHVSRGP